MSWPLAEQQQGQRRLHEAEARTSSTDGGRVQEEAGGPREADGGRGGALAGAAVREPKIQGRGRHEKAGRGGGRYPGEGGGVMAL